MIIVITRRTYDRVLRLSPRPHTDNPRLLSRDLVIVSIPDAMGEELASIHKHSEVAIEIILEGIL